MEKINMRSKVVMEIVRKTNKDDYKKKGNRDEEKK